MFRFEVPDMLIQTRHVAPGMLICIMPMLLLLINFRCKHKANRSLAEAMFGSSTMRSQEISLARGSQSTCDHSRLVFLRNLQIAVFDLGTIFCRLVGYLGAEDFGDLIALSSLCAICRRTARRVFTNPSAKSRVWKKFRAAYIKGAQLRIQNIS